MFVISFISNGDLKSTAIATNANDAVDLGYEWYALYRDETTSSGDYIAIDQQIKGKKENVRFAEIRMDQKPDKVMLYLDLNDTQKRTPIFSKRITQISKYVLVYFLEFALVRITEQLKGTIQKENE